ncbi:N-acetylmuramoyl-L-alanine amidase [Neisseria sp. Ec49-e6-T10]|uniref:N-acetylmuramoyl-L-alanine amidase n=1 Tax=Neisseria sp. Ec49-e6-T10 TaxID=3140744 RepID=UPI003EB76705
MKIVITAGHSNTDPGAMARGLKESELVADLRNIVASKLRAFGHTVITDGEGKNNLPLNQAIALIKQGQVAIELHFNAAESKTAKGVETIALPKNKALSQKLSNAVAKVLNTTVRGENGFIDQSKSARGRLGYVNAGGLILEVCFISNPQEMAEYQAKKWLVASAIADVLNGL